MTSPGRPLDPNAFRARARRLALLVFDVDGVLTDGRLYYGPQGEQLKVFHTLDGHGIKLLARAGVVPAVITGRNSPMVQHRMTELGMEHVIQGREDKREALAELASALELQPERIGYAGDDMPDVAAMEWVSLAFSVPGAHAAARKAAHHVTRAGGGQGAAREICDLVLDAREPPQ